MSSNANPHMKHIKGSGPAVVSYVVAVPVGKAPNAPRFLNDVGQRYWREYTRALIAAGMLFETDLPTLEDLCYWESLKHRGRDELPTGKLFMEYRDEDTNAITHTQAHAAFSNLRRIQESIIKLREKLGLTVSDRSGLRIARPTVEKHDIHRKKKNW